MFRVRLLLVVFSLLFSGVSGFAAEDETEKIRELESKIRQLEQQIEAIKSDKDSEQLLEIRRQLAVLAEELEKLRSGEKEVEISEQTRRSLGLGPSAARVYTKERGVSIAGYGEMLYERFDDKTDSGTTSGRFNQLDFLRAVIYFGYRFNDRFLFNSEIEFEHANTDEGEVAVEFANVDFLLNDFLTIRGGLLLVPMGFLNEFHEPNVFLGARRPVTETVIIPTTWRENGAGIVGRKGSFDYRAYVITPFNAAGFGQSGLRGGRQGGSRARIESPAFVARLDVYPYAGLLVGGSIYTGDSGFFSETFVPGQEFRTTIGETHAEYRSGPWEFRALYARASVDDVAQLNTALGLTGTASVGESLGGGYLQAGYSMSVGNEASLTPYIRFEKVDTQEEVPAGFLRNASTRQSLWTFGAEVRPITNLVIKADYQAIDNDANSAIDQFNIVLGYAF